MKTIYTLICLMLLSFSAEAQFGKLLDKAKKEVDKVMGDDGSLDIAGGLKEALETGVDEAVTKLSAENGYLESPYKIILPEEAQKVIDKVRFVPGFADVETNLINKMNAAAESAAKKATPIFVDAITAITFDDARKILFGEDDEATRYLERGSREALYASFLPVIQEALDEVNARTYWKSIVEKYNSLPLTKDVNPELDDHVNNKALDGMFGLIETKELGIRQDIDQRTSPLLQDVFAELDK